MKARIEKKLSKRLMLVAPALFSGAQPEEFASVLAIKQGSRVKGCLAIGDAPAWPWEPHETTLSPTLWELWRTYWLNKSRSIRGGEQLAKWIVRKVTTKELLGLAEHLDVLASAGPKARELKAEYQDLADEFQAIHGDGGCTCFAAPPCSCCTHPGNPVNLENNDDAWEDE